MGSYESEPWSGIAIADVSGSHSDWHTDNFTGGYLPNEEYGYDRIHEDMAGLSFSALEAFCTDIHLDERHPGELGWLDVQALQSVDQIDTLAGFVSPPEKAGHEERHQVIEHIKALRGALPWSDGERDWLMSQSLDARIDPEAEDRNVAFLEAIMDQTGQVVSGGKVEDIECAELLERFRQWRRQEGEYVDGAGLEQARTALAGLIGVLSPRLGLPAEFEEMRPGEIAIYCR
jgi:hypothetical protein